MGLGDPAVCEPRDAAARRPRSDARGFGYSQGLRRQSVASSSKTPAVRLSAISPLDLHRYVSKDGLIIKEGDMIGINWLDSLWDQIRKCAGSETCTGFFNEESQAAAQEWITAGISATPGENEGNWEMALDDKLRKVAEAQYDLMTSSLNDLTNTVLTTKIMKTKKVDKGAIPGNTCNSEDQLDLVQKAADAVAFKRTAGPPFSPGGDVYSRAQYGLCKENKPCTKIEGAYGVGTTYDCGVHPDNKVNLKDPFADAWVDYVAAVAKKFDSDWRDTPCKEH